MDKLFENEEPKPKPTRHVGHLHRKLFLLVFAIGLLAQGWLLGHTGLRNYYQGLLGDFKVILTVESPAQQDQLASWKTLLSQQQEVLSVQLFSPEDALQRIRQKNPQLVESLLQIGKNQMPAYFELTLSPAGISNIRPLADQLRTMLPALALHYHPVQARLISYVGALLVSMRVIGGLIVLALLAFMFLVEAAPYPSSHPFSGAISGILAALLAALCVGGVLYPWGLFYEAVHQFTALAEQLLWVVCSGLLGWTLAKWQRF